MDLMYKTKVTSIGGRSGKVSSEDKSFELALAAPKELGGTKEGSNPEQLFAAAYAACFDNAVRHVCRLDKLPVQYVRVDAEVSLYQTFEGNYRLGVKLTAFIAGLDQGTADSVVERAHKVCPYSDATKNNIQPVVEAVVVQVRPKAPAAAG